MAQTAYWIIELADDWVSDPAITGAQIKDGLLADGETAALANGSETGFATTGTVTITEQTAQELTAGTAYKVAWTVYDSELAEYADPVVGDYTTALEDLTAQAGSYTLTGAEAGLLAARLLTAEGGSFTLTGADAELTAGGKLPLTAEAGAFTLTGAEADLLAARLLAAEAGAYALTGADAAIGRAYLLSAEAGGYVLTGADLELIAARLLTAEAGGYALTGASATLTYSGAPITVFPVCLLRAPERRTFTHPERRTFHAARCRLH